MKQTARILSTYSADAFGVCSALFELGGMIIMHDASGCNSTYTTHDEPRWYDMDSMVYISGISEMEAIMGDDEKLIGDIVSIAKDLKPKFIAIVGTPIPAIIGTDYAAMASVIEKRSGISSIGIYTTGMEPYTHGIDKAFVGLAKKLLRPEAEKREAGSTKKANIIGLTPLDFTVNGQAEAIAAAAEKSGYEICARWAMGADLEELMKTPDADINIVVSSGGLGLAKLLEARYGIPYVIGLPFGGEFAFITDEYERLGGADSGEGKIVVLGEKVSAVTLAKVIEEQAGMPAIGVDATEVWEDDIFKTVKGARAVIADPLFKSACTGETKFIELPHEAYSGRIYRNEIPNLMTYNKILNEVKEL